MIVIKLKNINGLNDSLQVGDTIFATSANAQQVPYTSVIVESLDSAGNSLDVGAQRIVGTLARIVFIDDVIELYVKEASSYYMPSAFDYIMFSKNTQRNGDLTGYYAKAKFIKNSKEKAEQIPVSSQVVINSK